VDANCANDYEAVIDRGFQPFNRVRSVQLLRSVQAVTRLRRVKIVLRIY
jgi:hypothetical protein